jgi:hypothetical protein
LLNDIRIRIQEAKKHVDPVDLDPDSDPDPQHSSKDSLTLLEILFFIVTCSLSDLLAKKPTIITVSRSSEDDYCPPHQVIKAWFTAVFRIHDILVRIWIQSRGPVPQTNGSGSGCGSGMFFRKFFCLLFFEGTFT